jgi:hypothetical protein
VGIAVVTWWVITFRVLGAVDGDYGGFISISERLLAGDRLYADVYENKDPLFHYLFASSRIITPLGSWLLNIALLAVAASAVWIICRASGVGLRFSFLLAAVSTPLLLTGAEYFPGASHIPAVTMILVMVALVCRRHLFLAGLALAAIAGLKLILLPMGLALLLCALIFLPESRRYLRVVLGAVVGAATILGVLLARREFFPYLDDLRLNADYSQAAAGGAAGLSGIANHLTRVFDQGNQLMLAVTVLLLLGAWATTRGRESRPVDRFLLWATVLSLVYSLVVIAATGLWGHHGLVLLVPAIFSLMLFVANLPPSIDSLPNRAIPVVLLGIWMLAGMPAPVGYLTPLVYARANIQAHLKTGDEAQAILSTGSPTTYMRVGNARDSGHAFGLRDWSLACPRIFQEVWESREILDATLSCLPRANVILVSHEVAPKDAYPAWNEYVAGVERLLSHGYSCKEMPAGRVCRRAGS